MLFHSFKFLILVSKEKEEFLLNLKKLYFEEIHAFIGMLHFS